MALSVDEPNDACFGGFGVRADDRLGDPPQGVSRSL